MSRKFVALATLVLGLASFVSAPTAALGDPPPDKPNIVVFLLDDTNPTDGRLWNNPTLTPNLYDLFGVHGITYSNAFGETPLCCPSRATLLTGLHTHNHRVIRNDAKLFNPSENVGKELGAAGYQSMLIGKFMNQPDTLTPDQWTADAAGWSVFDAFSSGTGATAYRYYYNYSMFTKDQGKLTFGATPDAHSTRVIANRAVMRLQQADPAQPVFQLLSIFNTHEPNIPMPGFENDPRWAACSNMPPWDPPNYNEQDVSDKPPYVQALPLLPYPNGWPMVGYCREMLGVDWLVGQVVAELKAEGRFDNTMFVLASDNGMTWGQHRVGPEKQAPYADRVALAFNWTARWGPTPRQINEYVSDIDFAPTLCAIGGCTLGPYPGGQTAPDGISLLPLMDGTASNLDRDALLEDNFDTRVWGAVRTTPESPLGLWHYVEYQDGFIELYDAANDPWELSNLAGDPALSDLRATLHDRLFELLSEGRPDTPAKVTFVEDSVPNAGQDFSFGGDLGSFVLDDDSNATRSNMKVITGVAPGEYTLTQQLLPTWSLTSITCPFPTTVDATSGAVTLHLLANDDVTCAFKNVRRRPDLTIGLAAEGPYKGKNVYAKAPTSKQTLKSPTPPGSEVDYYVMIENDGKAADQFTIAASITGSATISATFWAGSTDVTAAIVDGTYSTVGIPMGANTVLRVRVLVAPEAHTPDKQQVVITARSVAAPAAVDVVKATTVV